MEQGGAREALTVSAAISVEEDAWSAMADHFLDTETRQDLPRTAMRCVEAGFDAEATRAAFFGRVAPVVGFNLFEVAGEWGAWDPSWLLPRLRAQTPAGSVATMARRLLVPGLEATATSLAAFVDALEAAPDPRPLADALAFLGSRYFAFVPQDPDSLLPDSRALLESSAIDDFRRAIEPAVSSSERRDGERRLATLSAQIANRRAAGIDLTRLVTGAANFTDEFGLPFVLPEDAASHLRMLHAGSATRAYHDLSHVAELFARFHEVGGFRDPVSVALAILFHDGIYDASQKDNEARSAEMMGNVLRRAGGSWPIARTKELILLTARHGSLVPSDVDEDAARFLDLDLAILATPAARFDAYERAIAAEYAHLPDLVFRAGRKKFLRTMLDRSRLYLSDELHARWDADARANLRRALGR